MYTLETVWNHDKWPIDQIGNTFDPTNNSDLEQ